MKCFDNVPNPAAPIGDPISMRTGSELASFLLTSYVSTVPGTSRVWVVVSGWVVVAVTIGSSDGSGSRYTVLTRSDKGTHRLLHGIARSSLQHRRWGETAMRTRAPRMSMVHERPRSVCIGLRRIVASLPHKRPARGRRAGHGPAPHGDDERGVRRSSPCFARSDNPGFVGQHLGHGDAIGTVRTRSEVAVAA